jgi:hypothetical protein
MMMPPWKPSVPIHPAPGSGLSLQCRLAGSVVATDQDAVEYPSRMDDSWYPERHPTLPRRRVVNEEE